MAQIKQGGGVNQSIWITDGGFDFYDLTITPSAEGAGATDAFDVLIQLSPKSGTKALKKTIAIKAWCGVDGGAATAYASATVTGLSQVTNGALVQTVVASRYIVFATDANGLLTIRVTEASGAHARYLFIELPDGRIIGTLLTWT